jgi:hypothetical protein
VVRRLLPAEAARVETIEQEKLTAQSELTLMTDGWDDRRHCSLYGTLAAERGIYPTILSLEDLTGKRGDADTIVGVVEVSLKKMTMVPEQVAAVMTDDPTTMKSVRKKLKKKWPWIIVSRSMESSRVYTDRTLSAFRLSLASYTN